MAPSAQPAPTATSTTTTTTAATTPSSNVPQPNRNPLGSAQSANYFSQMLNMMANNSIVNRALKFQLYYNKGSNSSWFRNDFDSPNTDMSKQNFNSLF